MSPNNNIFWRLLEWLAVACQLTYTGLYILSNPTCWYFAIAGSAAFAVLCFRAAIFAEAGLYVFYIGMAFWGLMAVPAVDWYSASWASEMQLVLLLACLPLVLVLGAFLKTKARGKMPFLDAATSVYSVLATWLMVNYVHDNWFYWIVIDGVSIYLYAKRKLYAGAVMFFIYLIMSIIGYFNV